MDIQFGSVEFVSYNDGLRQCCMAVVFLWLCGNRSRSRYRRRWLVTSETFTASTLSLTSRSTMFNSRCVSLSLSLCLSVSVSASVCLALQSNPKNWHHFCTPYIDQIWTDFKNYFSARIMRKFVVIRSLKIPPHLKRVATLLCEMSVS